MSGYYHWKKQETTSRAIINERLKKWILKIYDKHKGMIGSPMITTDLNDDPVFCRVSPKRVARLMREMDLKYKTVKKYLST